MIVSSINNKVISSRLWWFNFPLQTPEEWRIIFIIASGIYLIGAVIYGLYASGEIQSWADNEKKGEESKKSYDNPAMEVDHL